MPYATDASAPADVRDRFTGHCLTVWRQTWNDTFDRHHDEGRAFATAELAGQNCMEATKAMTDYALKFAGPDTVEGLAIPFGNPEDRDLDGEFFTKNTDLCIEWFGQSGRPLLYDHGLDKAMKTVGIGRQTDFEVRDEGIWATSQLDKNARYRKAVDHLIEEGALGYSSGAMQHLATKSKSGEITRWPWVELSMTPIPAHPGTLVHYVKSADAFRHMEDVDISIPDPLKAAMKQLEEWADIRDAAPGSEPFTARLDRVSGEVLGLMEHLGAYAEMRVKSGRSVSRSNWERIRTLAESMRTGLGDLDTFLAEHDPDAAKSLNAAIFEALQSESRRLGVPV